MLEKKCFQISRSNIEDFSDFSSSMRVLILVTIFLIMDKLGLADCGTVNGETINKIVADVNKNYNKNVIPKENDEPVQVFVNLKISDMEPIEDNPMHFTIDCYFGLKWNDYRLRYNATNEASFIPLDHHSQQQIWAPDLYFVQGKTGYHHNVPKPHELVWIYPNGTVRLQRRITKSSYCGMDMKYYPFDIQKCELSIESFSYNQDYLRLQWNIDKFTMEKSFQNTRFNKIILSYRSETFNSYGGFGNFSSLNILFTMHRNLPMHILRSFIPCILIVMLSWIGFWINHQSTPARVALGITTVLTIVTTTNNVVNNSPQAGLFRSLDYYLLFCNLFVFAALLEYAVLAIKSLQQLDLKNSRSSLILNTNEGQRTSLPQDRKQNLELVNQSFDRSLEVDNLNQSGENKRKHNELETLEESYNKLVNYEHHYIDRISRIIFPVCFAIMNIIYFAFHRLHPDTVN